jgi:hypothetical protein
MASAGRCSRHVTISAALSKPVAGGDLLKQDADLPKQLDPWVPGREVNFSIPRRAKTSATPPSVPTEKCDRDSRLVFSSIVASRELETGKVRERNWGG